jgi:hypothetical protein
LTKNPTPNRVEWRQRRKFMREQYSLAKILGIWALAAVPMGILGWIVSPLLAPDFESDPLGTGVTRVVLEP